MEFQNASVVWPDKVRPEASVIVPETMMGSSTSASSSTSRTANSAALAFKRVEYGLDQDDVDAARDRARAWPRRSRAPAHRS